MDLEDDGTRVKFVIHDRDANFTSALDDVLMASGARVIRSAAQGAPDEIDHERGSVTAAENCSTGPWSGTTAA
jgi:hypothetical protein